jgi:hypothetical protein
MPIVVQILLAVASIIVGAKFLGYDSGSVNKLAKDVASAPFSGTTWVFITGSLFLVALSYFQQHANFKSPVRPTPPRIPQPSASAPLDMTRGAEGVALDAERIARGGR